MRRFLSFVTCLCNIKYTKKEAPRFLLPTDFNLTQKVRRSNAILPNVYRCVTQLGQPQLTSIGQIPSAGCASAREKTEATGDPFAPPVRLSAPTGHGRPAPPLREASAPPDETASRGTRGRSREQGARGKRRAEPRRVFRGPTGRATRRFTSAVSGGSERRAPGSPRGWPVGGRRRQASERTAARSAPFANSRTPRGSLIKGPCRAHGRRATARASALSAP